MQMLPVTLSLAPRVVFDLRDEYQSTFTASLVPDSSDHSSLTGTRRSIARVLGQATFLADPTSPRDANWPFAETVELVTQGSAGGIRAFHGRIRTIGGVLLNQTTRQLVKTTTCRLTIQARGFQQLVLDPFEIPGRESTQAIPQPLFLLPAADYPFPSGSQQPSLLEGAIRRIDGTGMADAAINVSAVDTQNGNTRSFDTNTASDGRYLVVLDKLLIDSGPANFSHIDVKISHPDWAGTNVPFVKRSIAIEAINGKFLQPKRFVFPTTVLTGKVLSEGRPVPGATVSLSSTNEPLLVGSVRTNKFGIWELFGDARLLGKGDDAIDGAKLTATANGKSKELDFVVHYGKRNPIPPISLPQT